MAALETTRETFMKDLSKLSLDHLIQLQKGENLSRLTAGTGELDGQ